MNLKKMERGQRINLTKENPGLTKVKIGLSWDVKEGVNADLDAAAICLNSNEKIAGTFDSNSGINTGLVYYNNLQFSSIKHCGDNRTGEGSGDDEIITIDLNSISEEVESVLASITIYNEPNAEKVVFGRVKNATVRLYNAETNQALYEFDLTEDASNGTAVEMCRVYKKGGQWRFATLGEIIGNSDNGLEDIARKYQ